MPFSRCGVVPCACALTSFECGVVMAILTRIIEQLAAFLVMTGIPARESTLYAWILIYLLVSGFLAVFLIILFLRRRQRAFRNILPPSDRES